MRTTMELLSDLLDHYKDECLTEEAKTEKLSMLVNIIDTIGDDLEEAVERDTEEEPDEVAYSNGHGRVFVFFCKSCGAKVGWVRPDGALEDSDKKKFCPECGKRIKWREW